MNFISKLMTDAESPRSFWLRLSLVLLVFVAFAVGSYCIISDSIHKNAHAQVLETTIVGNLALRNTFMNEQTALKTFPRYLLFSLRAESIPRRLVLQQMEKFRKHNGFDELYVVVGNQGEAMSSTGKKRNLQHIRAFQSVLLNGRNALSGPENIVPNVERPAIVLAQPLMNGDAVAGVLVAVHYVDNLYQSFVLSFYQNSGFSYIIDSKGNVILSPKHVTANININNVFPFLRQSHANSPTQVRQLAQALAEGQTGSDELNALGKAYLVAYAPLGINDWFTFSLIPKSAIYSDLHRITMLGSLLTLLVLITIVFLMYRQSELKRKHADEIFFHVSHDMISRAFNNTYFDMFARRAIKERDCQCVIVIFNIWRFRHINKIIGYLGGDEFLRHVNTVTVPLLNKNEILARSDGGNFLMLLDYAPEASIRKRLSIIQQAVADFSPMVVLEYRAKLNFGVFYPSHFPAISNVRNMVDLARVALIQAQKNQELSVSFFQNSMYQQRRRVEEMESRMHQALADGEFKVFLQAKYATDGSQVVGAEALVRWQPKDGTLISPAQFIPLFERNLFINQLDEYVFTETCRTIKAWLDQQLDVLPISVNVSRVRLYHPNIAEQYRAICDREGVPPQYLEIEITESMAFEDLSALIHVVSRFRAQGFACALDDFGSGYSSFNIIRSLDINTLKLDRAFLHDSMGDAKDHAIIGGMVRIANELGINVVAEGVETKEQAEFLHSIDCQCVQGFLYARPQPIEEFAQRVFGIEQRRAVA